MKRGKLSHNGFTLVELLVSATILSIIVVSVVAIFVKGREIQVVDQNRREARSIVQNLFEYDYNNKNFDHLNFGDTSFTIHLNRGYSDSIPATVSTQINSNYFTIGDQDLETKKISVSIDWIELDGAEETISLSKWLAGGL
ncbi:hypothetical protein CHISP_2297 [Chitinispirillum alkaliphilum]|nr:hypothetical protein CHISP_2297 [Chitinispirillum alkaliphilum]